MKKQEKIFAVTDMAERLKTAKSLILTDYRGLTVNQISQLRSEVKKAGGQLLVVKNTLLNLALKESNLPEIETQGPTAIIIAYEDEIQPLKAVYNFAKTTGLPSFKSGLYEDQILTREEIEKLGTLPTKSELIGKLLGLLSLPTIKLIQVLKANPQKMILILKSKGGEN